MGEAKRRKKLEDNAAGMRVLLARTDRGDPPTVAEIMDTCPFRTLVGTHPPGLSGDALVSEMMGRLAGMVALIEETPSEFDPDRLAEILEALHAGRTFMVCATHRAVRDQAKAVITGMLSASQGQA